jgi:flavodoxin
MKTMNACVVYFSRTGNTKRLAKAIADQTQAGLYDLTSVAPSTVEKCDLLILGTPVEGGSPAKETAAFIAAINHRENGKAILFCTYRLFGNNRTLGAMEKQLETKGYSTILKVSKKGMKPEKETDFSDVLAEIKKILEKQ